jgi:RHS repeat-associated protein
MIKNGHGYQLVTDHLESVRLVVDVNCGDVVQRLEYDEYGNVISDSNPDFEPFGYAGGFYDAQTKLVRFGARDYDANVGRWTCKDPIGFRGNSSNFYEYCLNDPINLIDPTGRQYIPFEQSFSAYLGVEGIGAMGGYVISGAVTVQGNRLSVIVSAKPKIDALDNVYFYGRASVIICDNEVNSSPLVDYGNAGINEQGSSYVGEANFELNQGTIELPDDLQISSHAQRISIRIEVGYSTQQPEGNAYPYPYMQGVTIHVK